MGGAPGLILDSDVDIGSDHESDSTDDGQNVTIEEVPTSDNEPQEKQPAAKPKLMLEDKKASKDVSKESTSKQQQSAKETAGAKQDEPTTDEETEGPAGSSAASGSSSDEEENSSDEEKEAEIKSDTKSLPFKEKLTEKKPAKKEVPASKQSASEPKATEVKKVVPKAENKKKVEQSKKDGDKKKDDSSPKKPLVRKSLPGGTTYEVLAVGNGKQAAKKGKKVSVAYRGTLKSGKEFDKGVVSFHVGSQEVVAGFDKGVEGMMVGEKRRLLVPAKQGYGSNRVGSIPPNSDLIFEITLRSVQ
eukprot:Gregarina_sp_Poly_1__11407@NODE_96_length_14647_cov_152_270302_g83_i0_p5_GENE_NODE_96_length_14647_cov_152_270302_g83_i0NODE_96_length_14647_cov_152_270302_g83_i0_p5_ORF_typecomplete_len302_score76_88FKBP_C/PF00254_28/1_1e24Borrelia_P83/PF05262_11/2_5_NODE_96_length_14647_cov_152_270302_g83_i022423147